MFQLHPNQVKLKHKAETPHKDRAIRSYPENLSMFGYRDLHLKDKPSGSKSFANLGGTYELPQG